MSDPKNYYQSLGVSKNSSESEIKSAYRKMAMKYHPDRNKGDKTAEKKFKEVSEAYEVLSNKSKKQQYDTFGSADFGGGGRRSGGHPGFDGFSSQGFSGSSFFDDIFEEVFTGGRGGSASTNGGRARGQDLRYDVAISMEDAYSGTKITAKVPKLTECDACNGYGTHDGNRPAKCGACNGMGKTRIQQGFFTMERPCGECNGSGERATKKCSKCYGKGVKEIEKDLIIDIPKGVEDGMQLRLSGEGNSGKRGGAPGDLYIFIKIKKHDIFQRSGSDIHCKLPVDMVTAALGGKVNVPNIDGSLSILSIPKGIQPGDKLKMKTKGMSILNSSSKGDMYVEVAVEIPVSLTAEQRGILEKFSKTCDNKNVNNPQTSSFFDKIKNIWQ